MSATLHAAIVERATRAGAGGAVMGALVDELVREGFDVDAIERGIWELLAARRLTPAGFVCRVVQRRGPAGTPVRARAYEPLLLPWSPERDGAEPDGDGQLPLPIAGEGPARGRGPGRSGPP